MMNIADYAILAVLILTAIACAGMVVLGIWVKIAGKDDLNICFFASKYLIRFYCGLFGSLVFLSIALG